MVNNIDANIGPCSGDNIFVIIVAAGTGSRFGSDVPKQFLTLCGKPVLQRTVEAFQKALPAARIVLVVSEWGREHWAELCSNTGFESPETVIGGASRTDSVHNALKHIHDQIDSRSVVLVHDGARPLVKPEMVARIVAPFADAEMEAVLPVVALTEAVSVVDPDGNVVPSDRALYRTVQTPQAFRASVLSEAYAHCSGRPLPDDAAVYHAYTGRPLHTVDGDYGNIKITNPADLAIASMLIDQQ